MLGAEQSVWLPDEESAHAVERPLAAGDFEMTPLQVAMPSEGDRATEGFYEVVRHGRCCLFTSLFSISFVLCEM